MSTRYLRCGAIVRGAGGGGGGGAQGPAGAAGPQGPAGATGETVSATENIYNSNAPPFGTTPIQVYRLGDVVTIQMPADVNALTITAVNDLFIGAINSNWINGLIPVAWRTTANPSWTVNIRVNGTTEAGIMDLNGSGFPGYLRIRRFIGGPFTSAANGGLYAFTVSYLIV